MEIIHCPICNSTEKETKLKCTDYFVTKEQFEICACKTCGFNFTNPRPDDDKIGAYYESEDYISHSETKKGIVNQAYILARKFTLKSKVRLVKSLSKGREILDIGCGGGSFLNACKENGLNIAGFEPSAYARKHAKEEYGLDILPIEEIYTRKQKKDVITMWHVLEHVSDLNGYFKCFNDILKDDGTLVIALPNRNSWDAKHYKEHWAAYDVPRHLWHFNKDDITQISERHGFKLERVIPMKLDAFYIAMLSEKYIHGKNKLMTAFFKGLYSNLHASFNKKEYSSLIYVLRKG